MKSDNIISDIGIFFKQLFLKEIFLNIMPTSKDIDKSKKKI